MWRDFYFLKENHTGTRRNTRRRQHKVFNKMNYYERLAIDKGSTSHIGINMGYYHAPGEFHPETFPATSFLKDYHNLVSSLTLVIRTAARICSLPKTPVPLAEIRFHPHKHINGSKIVHSVCCRCRHQNKCSVTEQKLNYEKNHWPFITCTCPDHIILQQSAGRNQKGSGGCAAART